MQAPPPDTHAHTHTQGEQGTTTTTYTKENFQIRRRQKLEVQHIEHQRIRINKRSKEDRQFLRYEDSDLCSQLPKSLGMPRLVIWTKRMMTGHVCAMMSGADTCIASLFDFPASTLSFSPLSSFFFSSSSTRLQ